MTSTLAREADAFGLTTSPSLIVIFEINILAT